jgi:hypothetical protein
LGNGGRRLSSLGKKLIKEGEGLSSLETTISVGIILVEDVHGHDLYVFVLLNWEIKEVLDEEEGLKSGDNSIIV